MKHTYRFGAIYSIVILLCISLSRSSISEEVGDDNSNIKRILNDYYSGNSLVSQSAKIEINKVDKIKLISVLNAILFDRSRQSQVNALRYLSEICDESSIPVIQRLIQKDTSIAEYAIRCLGKYKSKLAEKVVIDLLFSESADYKKPCLVSLSDMRSQSYYDDIINYINKKHNAVLDHYIKCYCYCITDNVRCLDLLFESLFSEDEVRSRLASELFVWLNSPTICYIIIDKINQSSGRDRDKLIGILSQIIGKIDDNQIEWFNLVKLKYRVFSDDEVDAFSNRCENRIKSLTFVDGNQFVIVFDETIISRILKCLLESHSNRKRYFAYCCLGVDEVNKCGPSSVGDCHLTNDVYLTYDASPVVPINCQDVITKQVVPIKLEPIIKRMLDNRLCKSGRYIISSRENGVFPGVINDGDLLFIKQEDIIVKLKIYSQQYDNQNIPQIDMLISKFNCVENANKNKPDITIRQIFRGDGFVNINIGNNKIISWRVMEDNIGTFKFDENCRYYIGNIEEKRGFNNASEYYKIIDIDNWPIEYIRYGR